MRTEEKMFELILGFARQDERVRAVILDGSRADPEASRDVWQDYDIIYLVTNVQDFKRDPHWIDFFGELMILQLPDDMGDSALISRSSYCYLMQFKDGTRIDLTLYPVDEIDKVKVDSYCYPLLDKDGVLKPEPFRNLSAYYPLPPTAKQFADCCNEFWWCSPYVAKGLWRGEILYAHHMLDEVVREELMKMLTWYIGIRTGFQKNPGKYGKRFHQFLEPERWELLKGIYSTADIEETWSALFTSCDLFRRIGLRVAEHFGYEYPLTEDRLVYEFLEHIKATPKDAE